MAEQKLQRFRIGLDIEARPRVVLKLFDRVSNGARIGNVGPAPEFALVLAQRNAFGNFTHELLPLLPRKVAIVGPIIGIIVRIFAAGAPTLELPDFTRWGEIKREKMSQVPATSPESDLLSKDLKKRGFKFVGSTIMYAHLQACGLVNDHTTECFRYQEILDSY